MSLKNPSYLLEKKRLALLHKTKRLRYYIDLLQHAEFLIQHLAADMKVSQKEIVSRRRKPKSILLARALLYKTMHKTYPLEDIAYAFNRHHTTVLHALKWLHKDLYTKKNQRVRSYFQNLEKVNNSFIKNNTEKLLDEVTAHITKGEF